MIDTILKASFVLAALIVLGGGLARAQSVADEMQADADIYRAARDRYNASTYNLPNPDPAYNQPPISTVLQNQEFTNQSYRIGR